MPPLSALYLTTPGGLGIVRNGALMLRPFGFGPGAVLTVSEDLGIRVMHGMPPWFPSRAFTLDAMPTTSVPTRLPGLCCFYDGTTDGQFNYAPRTDSTLLEPLGSRPLAPAALYRFKRDWSAPERMFLLSNITATAAGVYSGVAYSDRTRAFFLLRAEGADTFLERWTADGTLQATVKLPSLLLGGLAIDPRDGTLWSNDSTELTDFHLENLDLDGRRLGSFRIAGSWTNPLSFWSSLEFAWPRNP